MQKHKSAPAFAHQGGALRGKDDFEQLPKNVDVMRVWLDKMLQFHS